MDKFKRGDIAIYREKDTADYFLIKVTAVSSPTIFHGYSIYTSNEKWRHTIPSEHNTICDWAYDQFELYTGTDIYTTDTLITLLDNLEEKIILK